MLPTFIALARLTLVNSVCLPQAVEQRKNISNALGESYPLGFLVGSWSSARLSSALIQILTEEVLGYNTRVDPTEVSSSVEGMYALLGCATWQNVEDRGCSTRNVRTHLMTDSWWKSFPAVISAVQEKYEGEAPVFGGDMGFVGHSGTYIPRSVIEHGESEGLALEYYKSYDVRWHEPWKYYDNLTAVNASAEFMPCTDSVLADNSTMHQFLKITGDRDGLVMEGNTYRAKCADGYTWRSPSCRSSISHCLMWISGGDGWDVARGVQRAAVFNMPLAVAVAQSYSHYLALPKKYKLMLYWWTPDDSFLDIDPSVLILPPRDAVAVSQGDLTSKASDQPIEKVISADLESMAPDVVQLLQGSQLQLAEINEMMRMFTANEGASRYDVACQWLKANPQRWQGWIPDKTRCGPGFGLFDEAAESFTSTRASASGCRACPPGTYAEPYSYSDGDGLTYICSECAAGTYQDLGASLSCTPCPKGEFQDLPGSRQCARCGIGFYQDLVGQTSCTMCPAATTTLGIGSLAQSDCGCREGTINVAPAGESLQCQACSEGLRCPLGSTVDGLVKGEADLGDGFVPELEQGYSASTANPLSVHKCMSNCPGGKPGTCSAGLQGRTCAECPTGQVWNGETCADCRPEITVIWLLCLLAVLVAVLWSYHFVNSAQYQQASTTEAVLMSCGLVAYTLQNLALVGMMSVRWTSSFQSTTSAMSIFLFDNTGLGLGCLTGVGDLSEFAAKVVIFPAFTIYLLARWGVSTVLPFKPWVFFKTVNTIGVGLQLGFATMVAVAVKPMMCYSHPNGRSSVLEYPSTFCGESTQLQMVVLGVVLLVFAFGFIAICAFAAVRMPLWSARMHAQWVQAFRFLTAKFRLGCWWFGLGPLLRSLCFTLAVALFPDAPNIQAAIGSIVLAAYVSCEIALWPWKVPIVNIADSSVTFILLILLGHAEHQDVSSEEDFIDVLTMVLIFVMLAGLALLVCLNILAVLMARRCGGRRLLNLGANMDADRVATALTTCAVRLMDLNATHIGQKCRSLNALDLNAITQAITIVATEVLDGEDTLRFYQRVGSCAMGVRLSMPSNEDEPACNVDDELGDAVEDDIPPDIPPTPIPCNAGKQGLLDNWPGGSPMDSSKTVEDGGLLRTDL